MLFNHPGKCCVVTDFRYTSEEGSHPGRKSKILSCHSSQKGAESKVRRFEKRRVAAPAQWAKKYGKGEIAVECHKWYDWSEPDYGPSEW